MIELINFHIECVIFIVYSSKNIKNKNDFNFLKTKNNVKYKNIMILFYVKLS